MAWIETEALVLTDRESLANESTPPKLLQLQHKKIKGLFSLKCQSLTRSLHAQNYLISWAKVANPVRAVG